MRTDRRGNICILHFDDTQTIDQTNVQSIDMALFDQLDAPDVTHAVIDLSGVKFFGTSFIEVLFRGWRRVCRKEGEFYLTNLLPYPAEILKVAKLDQLWSIADKYEDAVESIRKDSAPE